MGKVGRPYGQSDILTPDEIRRMLRIPDRSTIQGKRDYALLMISANTPLTKKQICNLKRGDIIEKDGHYFIRACEINKTKKISRRPTAIRMLREDGTLQFHILNMAELRRLKRPIIMDEIPNERGIYFLFGGEDLLYIGKTKTSFKKRLKAYREDRQFTSVAFHNLNNDSELIISAYEKVYLDLFNPPLNDYYHERNKIAPYDIPIHRNVYEAIIDNYESNLATLIKINGKG